MHPPLSKNIMQQTEIHLVPLHASQTRLLGIFLLSKSEALEVLGSVVDLTLLKPALAAAATYSLGFVEVFEYD